MSEELLRRFAPRLRYDSNEQYFADSPAQWTDCPGNTLRATGGKVIAKQPELTLDYLGGYDAKASDFIANPTRGYRAQYVQLRIDRPDLKNRMYGRALEDNGRLWLQYWLWYFYNDYSLALGAGLHEGDWEMVQLRMHGEEPDVAVYAQHTHAEKRAWPEVETEDDGHPVVYVARGSHASYFEAGYHTTEAWYDLADGKRPAPELALEILDKDGPGWARWPGRWGDTQPRVPGLHQPSPTGPGAKEQWTTPDWLLEKARTVQHGTPAQAPEVRIDRHGEWMRITFDFERRDPAPRSLVVTVNSRDEDGVPPRTYTFSLEDTRSGTLNTRIPTDPAKHYDIYTSTTAGDPPVPSESTLTELDPVGKVMGTPFLQGVAQGFGRLVAWIRGHLKRR